MLNRSNLVLIFLLLVQLVLLAASVLIASSNTSQPVEPILPNLDSENVTSVTIAAAVDGEVTLARGEDGWVLPTADDFPANGAKVDEFLEKLAGLNTSRVVATNPANFARFEVADADFHRKVSIVADDARHVMMLGGNPGADAVFVRRDGENLVYLSAGLNAWDVSTLVSNWIDARYVDVSQADVTGISVRNAAGSFDFARAGESWMYQGLNEGETFDDSQMPRILLNAATIRMVEPLGLTALDEYGIAEPEVTVKVAYRERLDAEADEGEQASDQPEATEPQSEIEYGEYSFTLLFGARLEDGNVALKASDADYYVAVRESVFTAFSDISHASLLMAAEAESGP